MRLILDVLFIFFALIYLNMEYLRVFRMFQKKKKKRSTESSGMFNIQWLSSNVSYHQHVNIPQFVNLAHGLVEEDECLRSLSVESS